MAEQQSIEGRSIKKLIIAVLAGLAARKFCIGITISISIFLVALTYNVTSHRWHNYYNSINDTVEVVVPEPITMDTWLAAISWHETGDNPTALGKDGEVSQYQILPIHFDLFFTPNQISKDPVRAKTIAGRLLRELCAGFMVQPFNLKYGYQFEHEYPRQDCAWEDFGVMRHVLAAYNAGYTGARVGGKGFDYADKIINLVDRGW